MKQTIDISSGNATKFNAGQSGKYLILRQASQSVILKGDNLRPVELERGDVVDVSDFDELEIYNHNSTSVHIEFQVSDVEVRIRTSQTSINGALNINEIQSPVVISRIQEPMDVQVNIPEVEVNIPDVAVTMPDELTIGNFPDVQQVEITNHPESETLTLSYLGNYSISAMNATPIDNAGTRKGYLFQAPKTNSGAVTIGGIIELEPGGHANVPANNRLSLSGNGSDRIKIAEWV